MMLKKHEYTPAHLFLDQTPYFITGAIYLKRPLLSLAITKAYLLEVIQSSFSQYEWELHHWVILDNHYHLLGRSHEGKKLSSIIRRIHIMSGYYLSQQGLGEKPFWWNYWDYCPRDEADYMIHLNYLLNNPIKHGYVTRLYDYPFSSFHDLMAKVGREQLVGQFKQYPDYRQLEIARDDF